MTKKIFSLLILLIMAAACLDEPDCYQLNNHIVGIAFKKLEDSRSDTVSLVSIHTLEPPLLFLNDTTDLTRVSLPLNYFQDETTYFFDDMDSVRMLRMGYVSQAQFVSENCGEKFVLSGLRVIEHTFDSVRLVSDFPTRDGGSIQIEIFQ
jgi:hypothetical protein